MGGLAPAPRALSRTGWAALAVVLVALDLRGPLVALPAVSTGVRSGLGTTAGAVGLLASAPVLCWRLLLADARGTGLARAGASSSPSRGWRWPLAVVAGSIAVLAVAGSLVLPGPRARPARGLPEG